jgi:hypothetical protein
MRVPCLAVLALLLACARPPAPPEAPDSALRQFTGAHTRVVWVQGDGTDPETEGNQLVLMGLDSDDGRGERVILGEKRSYVKPRLTAGGTRIVFSTRIVPGPPEIFVVDWDGSGLKKLADGFAMAVWQDPKDGRDWVYAGIDNVKYDFRRVERFPLDAPAARELVWDTTLVSMEGFAVSPDGRYAGGMWPWPAAGVADLAAKTWRPYGEGCWTSMTSARGLLFWYFDGAHRNVTISDVASRSKWMVNINGAPGFEGAEVSHPRWTNHPRFITFSGPYNQGGENQVRSGGRQVEVHLARFRPDFTAIESWLQVTKNVGGDSHPDVWIDLAQTPFPRVPAGAVGPATSSAPERRDAASSTRVVLTGRLARTTPVPTPASILPYRHALVVSEYDVVRVHEGPYNDQVVRVAEWAIRDGQVLGQARKAIGDSATLTLERYDAHPELEGERVISSSEASSRPLYYNVSRQ